MESRWRHFGSFFHLNYARLLVVALACCSRAAVASHHSIFSFEFADNQRIKFTLRLCQSFFCVLDRNFARFCISRSTFTRGGQVPLRAIPALTPSAWTPPATSGARLAPPAPSLAPLSTLQLHRAVTKYVSLLLPHGCSTYDEETQVSQLSPRLPIAQSSKPSTPLQAAIHKAMSDQRLQAAARGNSLPPIDDQ